MKSRGRAAGTSSPWWRYLAAAVLIFDGATIALYGPILPLPQWPVDLPLLGGVPLVPLLAGAALLVVGIGVIRGTRWARVIGIVVALAHLTLGAALAIGSGSITVLIESLVPAFVVYALAFRWETGVDRGRVVGTHLLALV